MEIRAFNLHHLSFWYHKRLKRIFCFALRESDQASVHRVQSEYQGFYFSYHDRLPVQKGVRKCSYLRKGVWSSVYREKLTGRAPGSCYYITLWLWAGGFTSVFHPTHLQHFHPQVRRYFMVISKMLRDGWRFNHPKIKPQSLAVKVQRKGSMSGQAEKLLSQVPVATAWAEKVLNAAAETFLIH